MDWKDGTSYSRGQRGIADPSVWKIKLGDKELIVHRYVGIDGWYYSCYKLNIQQRPLESTNIEEAKEESLNIFLKTVSDEIEKLNQTLLAIQSKLRIK